MLLTVLLNQLIIYLDLMCSLFTDIVAEITAEMDIMSILSRYNKMYFMSYTFLFYFTLTISGQQFFLKLTYKAISQTFYKYKLLKFPLDCDLDKELLSILLNLYQKNTELEYSDHKLTRRGILKNICASTRKTVTFDLLPIE